MKMRNNCGQFFDTSNITRADLVLERDSYPELYQSISKDTPRYSPKNSSPENCFFEQPSLNGLALLSYLYGQKEQNIRQPIIASDMDALKYLLNIINKINKDVEVVAVCQPKNKNFNTFHKNAIKINKTGQEVKIVYLDSVKNCKYYAPICEAITSIFTCLTILCPDFKEEDKGKIIRQASLHECGVFAFKDAKDLLNMKRFSEQFSVCSEEMYGVSMYKIPSFAIKSSQSNKTRDKFIDSHRQAIVTKDSRTLEEVYKKHKKGEYIRHFNKKYLDKIETALEQLSSSEIIEAVKCYNACEMTEEKIKKMQANDMTMINDVSSIASLGEKKRKTSDIECTSDPSSSDKKRKLR